MLSSEHSSLSAVPTKFRIEIYLAANGDDLEQTNYESITPMHLYESLQHRAYARTIWKEVSTPSG